MTLVTLALVAVVVPAATGTGTSTAAAPASASSAPRSPSSAPPAARSRVRWHPCRTESLRGLRCARMRVPLDYDRPRGARLSIAMAKLSAARPGRRIGTLFVNPGGPGGAARPWVRDAARLLGPAVARRFDIVGVDPRGIGGSARLDCVLRGPVPDVDFYFPVGRAEERRKLRFDAQLRRACHRNGGPVLDHMTTADTARDMDRVRRALGERRLTYYGLSYGSHLGTTYAAMFPRRVRAVLVDSVLDPVTWTRGRGSSGRRAPLGHRVGGGRSSLEALTTAFAECDRVGRARCPLAGDALGRWRELARRVQREPVRFDGERLDYAGLIGLARGALYVRADYRPLMRTIRQLHDRFVGAPRAERRTGSDLGAQVARLRRGAARAWQATTVNASYQGVACSDSVNPRQPSAWTRYGRARNGFDRFWTWLTSTCLRWPGSDADAWRGPWTRRPATPLLLASNRYDPATPLAGARSTHRLLPGSRLVTTTGWGHGVAGTSACARRVFTRYLVSRTLPARDVRCAPDHTLFPPRR